MSFYIKIFIKLILQIKYFFEVTTPFRIVLDIKLAIPSLQLFSYFSCSLSSITISLKNILVSNKFYNFVIVNVIRKRIQ
jgi:hypothetical protein